ncbi:hypothetical protein GCM10011495_20820 [Hymenobacter frigidus]|uniref:Uncharacterized protein n=1 Tax=Hymenobacter frigidus TaxID=1524095 RepID=A0ABQ2A469_9BACT|nr:hypothetical protein [Hymenobacter frigidus]GGH85779.1 hypothetical protein GCM10011495_20820 [Hymenobacter frigidus]
MPENVLFVPECHVDTALTRSLLADRLTFINHQHGISKVANVLRQQAESGKARFVVGMVDKDKKFADVKYLRPFAGSSPIAARPGPDCRYSIHQHPEHLTHYLIVMEPACDTWIFETAHAAGLNLTHFDLPTTLPAFIELMKDEDAEDNPRLIRLLRAIKQAQPAAYRELAEFVADVMDQNGRLWREY